MAAKASETEIHEDYNGNVRVDYRNRITGIDETYMFNRTSFEHDTVVSVARIEPENSWIKTVYYTADFLNNYDHPEFEEREFEGPVTPGKVEIPDRVKKELEDEGFTLEENELF